MQAAQMSARTQPLLAFAVRAVDNPAFAACRRTAQLVRMDRECAVGDLGLTFNDPVCCSPLRLRALTPLCLFLRNQQKKKKRSQEDDEISANNLEPACGLADVGDAEDVQRAGAAAEAAGAPHLREQGLPQREPRARRRLPPPLHPVQGAVENTDVFCFERKQ
eukprot:2172664-Rhodomonas_salina.1